MIKIYAPASIGNVGVGFDVLGAAITPIDGTPLGDYITVENAERFSLTHLGRFAHKLPLNERDNIVYLCWQRFCQAQQKEIPVALQLEKNMPIGSGLGSSACSIVATFVALNELCHRPFDSWTLLQFMAEMEGKVSGSMHYDNVAPCYLGGVQLLLAQTNLICQTIPHFSSWYWVIAYPGINVATAEARAILPSDYRRSVVIEYGRHLAGFIHASYSKQAKLAAKLMQDVVAEPYRTPLLPGYLAAKQAMQQQGALTCAISGSGPTLFTIADTLTTAQQLADWLTEHYLQNEDGFVHICQIDTEGARQIG